MKIEIHIVAKRVTVDITKNAEGKITAISGEPDPERAWAILAVNAGLKNGRDLQSQSLRTLALRELIFELMGHEG